MAKNKHNGDSIGPSDRGTDFASSRAMKKKILVADDDPGLRDIFKIIFEKAGYDVQLLEDASQLFKKNFRLPDIFLIDKLLSGIDGVDVCRFLKNDPLTEHIPAVMVSASPDIAAVAVKAGADDFVEKPFDMKYLLQVIDRNISRTKTRRSSTRTVNSEK